MANSTHHKELREHLATTEGQDRGTFLIGDGFCNVFGIRKTFLPLRMSPREHFLNKKSSRGVLRLQPGAQLPRGCLALPTFSHRGLVVGVGRHTLSAAGRYARSVLPSVLDAVQGPIKKLLSSLFSPLAPHRPFLCGRTIFFLNFASENVQKHKNRVALVRIKMIPQIKAPFYTRFWLKTIKNTGKRRNI